jgi:hypothetical protein
MTPHNIHAGKNEPRRLKDGAREHPVTTIVAAEEAVAAATLILRRGVAESDSLVTLRSFGMMEQVSRLKG